MAKKLTRTVFVEGVAYGPSSAIPTDVAAKITNPKVWADADDSALAPAGAVNSGAPSAPAAGADVPVPDAEATVKELRDYAKAQGITLGTAKAKPEILKVLGLDGPDEDSQSDEGDQESEGSEASDAESSEDGAGDGDPDADDDPAGDDE